LRIASTLIVDADRNATLDALDAYHTLKRDGHVERRFANANEKQTTAFVAIGQCESTVLAHHQRCRVDTEQCEAAQVE
jgi:hypothetical protein